MPPLESPSELPETGPSVEPSPEATPTPRSVLPPAPRSAPSVDLATVPRPPPDDRAVAALVLGILSVVGCLAWLGLPLGVPAILLGARAHRDIRRSAGLRAGHGLATAGIVLGSIGATLFFAWLGVVSIAIVRGSAERGAFSMPPTVASAVAEPIVETDSLDRRTTTTPPTEEARAGIVDLRAGSGPLGAQLAAQASAARRSGETLLVQTTAQRCAPCTEIDTAAADSQVQRALAKVRFLRIDVAEFRDELRALRMNEPAVPWFYLIDARGRASDAISADEWDENVPDNIAPVLGAFVQGTLRSRRQSWRGETAL